MKPYLTLIALCCTAAVVLTPDVSFADPPNIILILADDLGHGDLGYLGCKDIRTPHLDQLAHSGVILTDAHTTASVCAPSRAGLLSGQYGQRFGFECNSPPGKNGMPGSVVTYAEAMKEAGYETMGLGKWHLGYIPEMHPNQQGFDHFSGFLGGGRSYWPIEKTNEHNMMQRNGRQVPEKEIKYLTNWLTDEALRLIRDRDKAKPFFMYLSYNAPHTPMHALEEDLARYPEIKNAGRRTYAAMVDNLDQNIGKLRTFLQENKLSQNTLIIFASDNGGATINSSDNGIYRGMKGSKWEGGHRVPCIIYWPAEGLTGGKRCDMLISTLDFMATSLDAAGCKKKIRQLRLDGISLLPALRNVSTSGGHDTLYFRRSCAAGVRDGNWKLIRVENKDKSYRYLLFDLSKDIGETVDLTDTYPKRVKQLAAKLRDWEQTMIPSKWPEGEYWNENQRLKHRMDVIGRDAERKLP